MYSPTVKKILRSVGWLLLNQVTSLVLSLFLVWLFANTLDQATYGQYRFLTAAAAFLTLTSLTGMGITLTKAVAKGYSGTIKKIFPYKMKAGLAGSALAGIIALYYTAHDNHTLGLAFLIIAIAVPLLETATLYQPYLNGIKNFRRYSLSRLLQKIVVVATTSLTLIYTQHVLLIVAVYLVSTIITDLVILYVTLKKFPPNTKVEETAISYGNHLSLINGLKQGVQYLDKILLWYFVGPAQVAIHAIAMAIPQELASGLTQVSKVILPELAERNRVDMHRLVRTRIAFFYLLTIPLVGAYIFAAPVLFTTFFSQYSNAIIYTQLAAVIIFFAPNSILLQYFYVIENKKTLYVQNTIEPIIVTTLYLTLIPLYGVLGVIIALIIKQAVTMLLLLASFLQGTQPTIA